MNILFLSLFICAVAVPIATNVEAPIVPKTVVKVKSDPSVHLSMIDQFKQDPKGFVDSMSDADPDTLRTILRMLNELLTTSNDREDHLSGNLATAEGELDDANADVIAAEGVLSDAEQDQTDANSVVATATGDLAEKRDVQGVAQTEKDDAQGEYDDAIGSLDDEQAVLKQVISILTELLEKQPVKYYWAVGPIASTEVSDNVCGSDGILAMPKTKMEQQRLLDELPNLESGGAYEGSYAWLGGKFDVSSNSWKWNDGSPIGLPGTGETNWAQGEGLPENGEAQPLFGLIRPSGLWHDFHGLNAEVDEGQIAICQHAEVVENGVNMLKMVSTNQDFVQKGRHLLSSNALSVLKMFKKNSTSFISEMSKADPGAVKKIIAMLKELKETSEARENHLISELDQAIHELGEASNDVVKAEGALEAAVAAVAATTQDLAVKQMTQIEKQAIKDSAQETLDDELPGLDEEQDVITTVIGKLEELK